MDDYDLIQEYEFGIHCDGDQCNEYADRIVQLVCCKRAYFLCEECWAELSDFIIVLTINRKHLKCMPCEAVHEVPHAGFHIERI